MRVHPTFDCVALFDALDARRRERGLEWYPLADELWQQSADLNAERTDHPLCGGAIQRLATRQATSCQYALFMLRWLGRAPEDFLTGPVIDVGDVRLPTAGPDQRLRWSLDEVHAVLNDERRARGLTWAELAHDLGCTSSRLTNLRTARLADMDLVLRITSGSAGPPRRSSTRPGGDPSSRRRSHAGETPAQPPTPADHPSAGSPPDNNGSGHDS